MFGVDRDVPIAIARLEYRAGTARSTLPEVQKLFVIGISIRPGGRRPKKKSGARAPDFSI
jgi:hypothetical protein